MVDQVNQEDDKKKSGDLKKVVPEIATASYRVVMGKEPPKELAKVVKELVAKWAKEFPEQLMECDGCEFLSSPTLDKCPFCEGAPEQTKAITAPDDEFEDAQAQDMDDLEDAKEPTKNASKALAKANGANGHAKPNVVHEVEIQTEEMLDDAVKRLNAARVQTAAGMYMLGVELGKIQGNEIWRQRGATKGKPAYKSFAQFVQAEVSVGTDMAYKMIGVAKEFSEEQSRKFGNSILKALLGAPKDAHQPILERVESGEVKGKRGVQAEVDRVRAQTGSGVRGSKKTTKASAAASKKAKDKRAAREAVVTVAMPTGKKLVPLFAKGKKGDEKPAKQVSDEPWGALECANGTTLSVRLVKKGNQLCVVLEARREE